MIYEKNRFWNDLKTADRKSFGGILGFLFLIAAAVAVFVVVPALTYSGVTTHSPPQEYEILSHYSYPLLSAIRTSLIDPDTPQDALKMKAKDGSNWSLVSVMNLILWEGLSMKATINFGQPLTCTMTPLRTWNGTTRCSNYE